MPKRFFILFILVYSCNMVIAGGNLALRKSYTLSLKPNYYLCTDISDTIQLTDGRIIGSQWTNKSTVGWQSAEPAVEIVIDLSEKSVINEVRIHTVGGGFADVEFPEFVAVLLSDDGREFRLAGLVSSRNLANVRARGYRGASRTMRVGNINASGRYVKLVIRPNWRYVFLDEVEVFGGTFSTTYNTKLRSNLEVFNSSEELLSKVEDYLHLNEMVDSTVKTVKESRAYLPGKLREKILSELEILARKTDTSTNRLYSTDELLDIKRQVGKARAAIYKAVYKKPFVCLQANPMETVFEKNMYLCGRTRDINIQMWQNEYESAAFNIVNCTDEVMTMGVSISPLLGPAGGRIDSNKVFKVRRAIYVKGSTVGSIADALVLQTEPFNLQPGELRQIWLTVYSPTLAAGIYKGQVGVWARGKKTKNLPIETIAATIEVQKQKFPEKFALHTCNWAYYKVASAADMAEDLRNHHINVYTVPPQDLPFLRFSSDRPGVIRKPNFTKLDNALRYHNYAGTYLLCLDFNRNKKDHGRFGNVKWMSEQWKVVFSQWLKKIVKHLNNAGVGYDQFALYPFDESLCDDFYKLAKLIKETDPNIRIYVNSFGKGPKEFTRFKGLVDIWCLQDSHCERHPQWLEQIKGFGKQVWTYECLRPMKAKDPYSYFRLMPWRAFKRGQTGAGFWIYYYGLNFKTGAVPWDDTLRPRGFSGVVYGSQENPVPGPGENIIPSRRWEAWREGVEDYQYIFEVQKAIEKISTEKPKIAKRAQQSLNDMVDYVLSNAGDCNAVYKARRELNKILQEINSKRY
ncbi:MAG: DUF4091 domain-containing protein [Planctomycetes bacterium]|nr:DUF4091 domain-containing protein [Planctomycetota bacterium]